MSECNQGPRDFSEMLEKYLVYLESGKDTNHITRQKNDFIVEFADKMSSWAVEILGQYKNIRVGEEDLYQKFKQILSVAYDVARRD